MPTFTPPIRAYNSPVINWKPKWPQSPMKFFSHPDGQTGRGANVFVETDGTITEDFPRWENISKVYYGGHSHYVNDTEKAALEAAGYTVDSVTYGAEYYGGELYGG
jgi:hypothetical protein